MSAPIVTRSEGPWCCVRGDFYRAVRAEHIAQALNGSREAGRYSRRDQPTLYLSASIEGVAAAMVAYSERDAPPRITVGVEVEAEGILDLRSPAALAGSGFAARDAFSDWQSIVAAGGEPLSWKVRDWIQARGGNGLIDPSRQAPGVWHLVLFCWNAGAGPRVRLRDHIGSPAA